MNAVLKNNFYNNSRFSSFGLTDDTNKKSVFWIKDLMQ